MLPSLVQVGSFAGCSTIVPPHPVVCSWLHPFAVPAPAGFASPRSIGDFLAFFSSVIFCSSIHPQRLHSQISIPSVHPRTSVRGCFACSAPACGALRAVRFARECGRKKDLQPRRAVIHYDRNCILRSLRRFGRQGECGCKAPRVGHCEAAGRRISQNTRRLQAFLPEPEVAWLNEEISFGWFCCTCPPIPAGRIFLFWEEST